jgi:aerobic carbon-monoxide dehydrogenase large subunit
MSERDGGFSGRFGVGQPVPRSEDARLLRGAGRYTDDLVRPGQLVGYVLRSPHAAAAILAFDVDTARAMPGVAAVYTAADIQAAGIGPIPCLAPTRNRDGSGMADRPRPVLAADRVCHVGEPVAFIVAETLDQARDAAEAVVIDYDIQPAVGTLLAAAAPGAALVHADVPGNRCFDWGRGDATAVAAALAAANRVVTLELVNSRVVPSSLEGRACQAEFVDGVNRLWVSSQGVHFFRKLLPQVMGIPAESLHVLTGDVGGGFGMKIFLYPEYVLTLHAARCLGRPVKWTADRSESFLSDDHGRDNWTRARLGLDADGRFLGLEVETLANLGAWLSNYAPFVVTEAGTVMLSGVYTIPAISVRVQGMFSHTAPVDAYRGAGRPEAAYVIERLVDAAADELGLDPAEIRRRNFIPPDAMPWRTPLKHIYDSGDFARNLDDALIAADYAGFEERRSQSAAEGWLRGIGLSTYIEACAGGGPEQASIQIRPDGQVTLLIGTQTNGQGHETAYKQLLADRLGLHPDRIDVVQGDTARISFGGGTGGSRSIPVGGAALAETARKVMETLRLQAAEQLEAAVVDIEFSLDADGGQFSIVGTDRRISLTQLFTAMPVAESGFVVDEVARWAPPAATFPNGCHICELAVERETGQVRIQRYTVVDDFGTVLNPLLLAGQVHGGIAQGVGQALLEQAVYDPDSAQLLTGSFMDYGMPRADLLPMIDFRTNVVPCTTNALGMKGAGEAGTIGATPAVMNALVDALSPLGIRHIDMPATPETLWRLIRDAG